MAFRLTHLLVCHADYRPEVASDVVADAVDMNVRGKIWLGHSRSSCFWVIRAAHLVMDDERRTTTEGGHDSSGVSSKIQRPT